MDLAMELGINMIVKMLIDYNRIAQEKLSESFSLSLLA
jgi:hypothetical protein